MTEFFDFNKFFNWQRLIEVTPAGEWQFLWWAVGISIGLILIAIIRAFLPGDTILKHKTKSFLWTTGILGLILTFFRWQNLPYLSARVVWLGLFIIMIIWLATLISYRQRVLPKKILQLKIEERKNRYLKNR